jgi:hypothetical protein
MDCHTRFVSRTVFLDDIFGAHACCPKCDRADLNAWTGKTYTPKGWMWLKVLLGAYKWRCEYCHQNFASFRNRKEAFTSSRWKIRDPPDVAEKPPPRNPLNG